MHTPKTVALLSQGIVQTSLKKVPVLLLAAFWVTSALAQKTYSKREVLEDMAYLRQSLEETHYNLYTYTPKDAFEKNYQAITASVQKDSFDLLEATSLFQKVISRVNNGHTEIFFPIRPYVAYMNAGGSVFPLELAFENDKALVRKNWSGEPGITTGSEVLRIDGKPIGEILAKMAPQVSAERPYFKKAKMEFYSFPRLYWQVFGEQQAFEIDINSPDGPRTYRLQAINALDEYESWRKEVLDEKQELSFLGQSAYLDPGPFSGEMEAYEAFIDSAFAAIRGQNSRNLIVDLRNHSGGDETFGNYLISYFADKPFTWTSDFTLKTSALLKEDIRKHKDTTRAYWKEALNHPNGTVYRYPFEKVHPQPEEKRFRGQVYVLVNRQSHSMSTVTAAQIQDYGFGTIVGEETGEYPSLYASVFRYALPHTQVTVQVPKGYIVRVNGNTDAEGLIPDILIKDHLLDEEDEILEGLLKELN